MQSRLSSFIESMANVLIGYFVSLLVQLIVYPMFGGGTSKPMTLKQFRLRLEKQADDFDCNDEGGCGCALAGE